MRITEVEALLLRGSTEINQLAADGSQDALLVRVHTDEGVVGLGEVDSQPQIVKAIIDAPASHANATGLARLITGCDPLDIDGLWQRMFEGSIYYGRRGAAIHAISGIEIALWDIAGKVAGKPICELLGEVRRWQVPAYASSLMPQTPDEAKRVAAAQAEAGFSALKLGWGPLGRDADLDVELVAAARHGLGEDRELMIDIGMGWKNAAEGIPRALRMEEHHPYWIEEPFWPDQYADYNALAASVKTPIAAGEEETTHWDFERLIIDGGVAIVQPDVTRCGGMRECLRIEQVARRHGRRLVTHSWSTGIIKAASLHVAAVLQQAEYLEYCVQNTPLNEALVRERFPVRDGLVEVPAEPGLGITLDEEVLARCLVP
jgi:L-alanine-DL-glutamate epimerase-like enolase superfamily enzyme